MKYAALLRGVNVGGNNVMKMADLKKCFEEAGFQNVVTYIASGNVIFDSDIKKSKLTPKIENILSKKFGYAASVVVKSHGDLKKILEEAPISWIKNEDIRKNIAFLKDSIRAGNAFLEFEVNEGVDEIRSGSSVIYIATIWKDFKKSYLPRIIKKKVYKDMTIRTFGTTQKIFTLMEK